MATQNPSSTMQTTTHTSQPVMVVNQATTLGRGDLNSFKKNLGFAILCIILPPLAVFVKTGDFCETLINILWCILGWIPGVIHAFLICLSDTRCNTCTTDLAMTQSPGSTIDQMMVTRTPPVVVGVPTLVQPVVVVASDRPQGVTVVE